MLAWVESVIDHLTQLGGINTNFFETFQNFHSTYIALKILPTFNPVIKLQRIYLKGIIS
jgi:hypothetical protein